MSQSDPSRWHFPHSFLENSPSRLCGVDADTEMLFRQNCAQFIQESADRLGIGNCCKSVAIVYMHRFFTIHSFTKFDHMVICMTCVLLASKVEEVECVSIRNVINHSFLFSYKKKLSKQEMTRVKEDLRIHENILMATLGFDFRVSIPHIFILKYSKLLKATRQFEMSALNAATNSLLWTIMCLEYSPLFVACASMQVASQLENFMLPHKLPDGQCWYRVIDPTLTLELLNKITYELFEICKKYGMGRREDTFTPSPCLHTNFHRSNVEIKKPEKSKKRHRKISEPTNDYLPGTSNSDGPSETPAYFSFDPVLEKSDDNDKFPHKNSISGSDKNSKMKKFETELILEQDNQNEVLGQPRKTSRTVGRKELTCCPYYVQKILSSPDRRKHPHTQYYGRQVATEPFSPIKAGPPCTPMEKNHVEYGLCINKTSPGEKWEVDKIREEKQTSHEVVKVSSKKTFVSRIPVPIRNHINKPKVTSQVRYGLNEDAFDHAMHRMRRSRWSDATNE